MHNIILFLKGFAMGTANVIPGVSGGTIAFLTGIFERLINALKSFDSQAIKLFFKFRFREFAEHVDLYFLLVLFAGVGSSIFSVAKLLEYLFQHNAVYVWSFFFGLILASVYYVGKTVEKIDFPSILSFIIGTAVAVGTTIVNPAAENDNFFYLILCGVVAICCMILPGLSGSFILVLMGNYQLVMIKAVSHLDFMVLIPVGIGCVAGLAAFSRFLSWLLSKYGNVTLAAMTGFVLGSLLFIWPWKKPIFQTYPNGHEVFDNQGNPVIAGYDKFLPDFDTSTFIAIALMIAGVVVLCLIEEISARRNKKIEMNKKENNTL